MTHVTIFPDLAAETAKIWVATFDQIVAKVSAPKEYPAKSACPLIVMAEFGVRRTEKGSLRWQGNVLSVHGIEGDYDGEVMSLPEAAERLRAAGVQAALYTSPSHRPEKPRWRVLAPFSKPHPPREREQFVARLNGVLGGILAPESFRPAQSYYIGRVNGAVYEWERCDGTCIDLLDELDATAIGAPKNGAGRAERLDELHSTDPVVTRLLERSLVRQQRTDGTLVITCPFEAKHTTQGGDGASVYFPPLTGGYSTGNFNCKHSHCANRKQAEFREAIGLGARSEAPVAAVAGALEGATEDAMALELIDRHGDDYRYVPPWHKWWKWDGMRWREDSTGHIYALIRDICRDVGLRKTQSAAFVAGVERLARVDQRIVVLPEQLDADPWALNTPSGIVNLRTDKIRPHDRDALCTKITRAPVAAAQGGELWRKFLGDITQGDMELAAYLQRVAGYCATGVTTEDVLVYLFGLGANGKSSFAEAVAHALGDYALSFAPEVLMESKGERHPTELAQFAGVRLALTSEPADGATWNDSRIKSLTGDSEISARFVKQDFFRFRRSHKTVVVGNHMPELRTVTHAIRRRVQMVPFRAVFEPLPGEGMRERLRADAGGAILAWIVEGARMWREQGTRPPKVVTDLTAEYLSDQDVIGQWIEVRCKRDPQASERSSVLHRDYAQWCEAEGHRAKSAKGFSEQLVSSGFEKAHTMIGKTFHGLMLRCSDDGYDGSPIYPV